MCWCKNMNTIYILPSLFHQFPGGINVALPSKSACYRSLRTYHSQLWWAWLHSKQLYTTAQSIRTTDVGQTLLFLGPSLSKRQWNVYASSYHSHFDVVGLRRPRQRPVWTACLQVSGPFVKMVVTCLLESYHSHFWRVGLCDFTADRLPTRSKLQILVSHKVVVTCVHSHITASFDERQASNCRPKRGHT